MHVKHLTLKRLINLASKHDCSILLNQLAELPCPTKLRIGVREYAIPNSIEQFTDNICWGQRLYMASKQTNEFESILYLIASFYQPILDKSKFDDEKVLNTFVRLLNCNADEILPVLNRFSIFFADMIANEMAKLNREVTREMRAAEINKLQPFSDMSILELIAERCKVPLLEAHLINYNIVLVLLWKDKETDEFGKRYNELMTSRNGK